MVESSHPSHDTDPPFSLDVDRLTWAVLLGRWIDFARSALALPDDADGRRLRDAVPDMIGLQAVWFALQHLEELEPAERAIGLDRAAVLIERHTSSLQTMWDRQPLPPALTELIADATTALLDAQQP